MTSTTAFVLVPGAHTGGWVWEAVAGALRAQGAHAYPVTLTGMGEGHVPGGPGPAATTGPGPDLETHIQDIVRLVDSITASRVVLVGHCYGVHPMLAAAGRRPGRVDRLVFVDTAVPADGALPLELLPDRALRQRPAAETAGGATVEAASAQDGAALPSRTPAGAAAPPADWARWGSTAGVPEEALAELAHRAVPQPARTFTQPLRTGEAARGVPTTGVLCTANGSSIALVQSLVRLGDPRLRELADPRVGFFELDTGHWPMLSAPAELARVLRRAAAGEGHRLTPAGEEPPGHLRPFLLDVPQAAGAPAVTRERVGNVDLYMSGDGDPRPAVVFVHGGPVPAGARPTPRDWPVFTGYGRHVAASGGIGVTFDHTLHDLGDYERAAGDVAAAVDLVRVHPRVDPERVALWFMSAGGLLAADWLAGPPPWLRCVAASYPVLAPLPGWGLADTRFRPAVAVRKAGRLPVVLTRVELERPEIAATVAEFLAAATDCGADVDVIDVPGARHGFESLDHTEPARRAVERGVRTVLAHLRSS
ncbi:alpha/beta fold hydrolase [Streptomyces sp. HPF1205]|uniref:alpha/beta fold hydrolase n=1 Tax=Streptomyces sp. HPF1205 TaxID=2873262 RepID=UPI001CEC41D3|nr:alpha/beta fold hydrolase [Streptomyces sp. HPF1205]